MRRIWLLFFILMAVFALGAYTPYFDGIKLRGATQHQVPFWGASEDISASSDFTFNDSTNALTVTGAISGATVTGTGGIRIPGLAAAAISALSPSAYDLIYDTDDARFEYYNGSSWAALISVSQSLTYDGSDNVYLTDEVPPSLSGAVDNIILNQDSINLALTSGDRNICVGDGTCRALTTESDNVMIGDGAGRQIATASPVVYIGSGAGENVAHTADGSVFVGYQAGYQNSAQNNTFIGMQSGFAATTAAHDANVYVGAYAGYGANGANNVIIGSLVGYNSAAQFTLDNAFLLDGWSDCGKIGGLSTRCFLEGDMATDVLLVKSGVGAANSGTVRMYETDANGSHYLALSAPDSVTATVTWELPDGDGSAGQVLKTDGSGNLDWVTVQATTIKNCRFVVEQDSAHSEVADLDNCLSSVADGGATGDSDITLGTYFSGTPYCHCTGVDVTEDIDCSVQCSSATACNLLVTDSGSSIAFDSSGVYLTCSGT